MQRKSSWLIPSKAEWRAMLWGALYALVLDVAIGLICASIPYMPFPDSGGPGFWDSPIWFISHVLPDPPIWFLSSVLSDPAFLISYFGIPGFLSSLLYGMLGGLMLYRIMQSRARQRPLLGRDGWLLGAEVGEFIAIAFAAQTILAGFEHGEGLLGWGLTAGAYSLILSLLFTVLLAAVLGAIRGAHLLGTLRKSGMVEEHAGKQWIAGLLVVGAFAMYFVPAAVRQLVSVPSTPTTFTIPGDFGILSQQPCAAPCFQGITPGITSAKDALPILRKIGPCGPAYRGPDAPPPAIGCSSGGGEVTVDFSSGYRETKLLVDMIMLQPPARVTIGDFIAQYGQPDAVQAAKEGPEMSPYFLDSIYYDRSRVTLHLPGGALKDLTPQTEIKDVTYWSTDSYQQARDSLEDAMAWSGYGSYMPGTGPHLDVPVPLSTPTQDPALVYPGFGISMERACGFGCVSQLTIDVDGNVSYRQAGPGPIQDVRTAKITLQQIEALVGAIDKANVWAIEDQQDDRCQDCGSLILSVRLNGQSKLVSRSDALAGACGVKPPSAIAEPGELLGRLGHTIATIVKPDQWQSPVNDGGWGSTVAITLFADANGNGWPQPSEGLRGMPVQLLSADGTMFSGTTNSIGVAQFNLTDHPQWYEIAAIAPSIGRSYCFYLPWSGNMQVWFNVAHK